MGCLRRMLSTHSGLGSVLLALLGLWWKPGLVCRALGGRAEIKPGAWGKGLGRGEGWTSGCRPAFRRSGGQTGQILLPEQPSPLPLLLLLQLQLPLPLLRSA